MLEERTQDILQFLSALLHECPNFTRCSLDSNSCPFLSTLDDRKYTFESHLASTFFIHSIFSPVFLSWCRFGGSFVAMWHLFCVKSTHMLSLYINALCHIFRCKDCPKDSTVRSDAFPPHFSFEVGLIQPFLQPRVALPEWSCNT